MRRATAASVSVYIPFRKTAGPWVGVVGVEGRRVGAEAERAEQVGGVAHLGRVGGLGDLDVLRRRADAGGHGGDLLGDEARVEARRHQGGAAGVAGGPQPFGTIYQTSGRDGCSR